MKNEFSVLLRDLIRCSGLKNQSIADAVGYDLSYISKWLSGKMLPSDKSINSIANSIARCVCDNLKPCESEIYKKFGANNETQLENYISNELILAFNRSREYSNSGKEKIAVFHQSMMLEEAMESLSALDGNSADAAMIVDLLAMSHEDRLAFLGIQNGNFVRTQYKPEIFLSLLIDLNSQTDIIYDTLTIVHLLSSFSLYNFSLFSEGLACQKFCASILSNIMITGHVFPNDREISFATISENSSDIDSAYRKIRSLCKQKNIMFWKQDMISFVTDKRYIKSLVSTNIRWIVGHITELVLPDDIFNSVLQTVSITSKEEYERVHTFSRKILEQQETRIMVYETAISDMLATGELDFFNYHVILAKEQRKACIEYWKALNESNTNLCIIEGGFYSDFKHVYSPCIFISDSESYVRLEDAYQRENILICTQREAKDMFVNFFEEAWTKCEVVIHDRKAIQSKLENYATMMDFLS